MSTGSMVWMARLRLLKTRFSVLGKAELHMNGRSSISAHFRNDLSLDTMYLHFHHCENLVNPYICHVVLINLSFS